MADDVKIDYLGELSRLDVKPGDRFVITYPGVMSTPMVEHLNRLWKRFVGEDGPQVLVLDQGMKIGAIRDEAVVPPPPADRFETRSGE